MFNKKTKKAILYQANVDLQSAKNGNKRLNAAVINVRRHKRQISNGLNLNIDY